MTNNKAHLSPKVIDLFRPERVISPPEGWELQGKHGFNRGEIAQGNTIDLARLGDVLDWLETTQELPRKAAIELLLEHLEKGISQGVYWLKKDNYAERLSDDFRYWYPSEKEQREDYANELRAVRERNRNAIRFSSWDGNEFYDYLPLPVLEIVPPPEPLDALRKQVIQQWGKKERVVKKSLVSSTEDIRIHCNYLAVPITAAYAAWGYGRIEAPAVDAGVIQKPSLTAQDVTDWETLVSYRKNTRKGAKWDDKQRQVLKAELTRRIKTDKSNKGESQIKEEMASELGLESRQAIDFQLKQLGTTPKRDINKMRKYS